MLVIGPTRWPFHLATKPEELASKRAFHAFLDTTLANTPRSESLNQVCDDDDNSNKINHRRFEHFVGTVVKYYAYVSRSARLVHARTLAWLGIAAWIASEVLPTALRLRTASSAEDDVVDNIITTATTNDDSLDLFRTMMRAMLPAYTYCTVGLKLLNSVYLAARLPLDAEKDVYAWTALCDALETHLLAFEPEADDVFWRQNLDKWRAVVADIRRTAATLTAAAEISTMELCIAVLALAPELEELLHSLSQIRFMLSVLRLRPPPRPSSSSSSSCVDDHDREKEEEMEGEDGITTAAAPPKGWVSATSMTAVLENVAQGRRVVWYISPVCQRSAMQALLASRFKRMLTGESDETVPVSCFAAPSVHLRRRTLPSSSSSASSTLESTVAATNEPLGSGCGKGGTVWIRYQRRVKRPRKSDDDDADEYESHLFFF